MASNCVDIITKSTQCPVAFLGISAGKFVPSKGRANFMNFFKSTKVEPATVANVQLEKTTAECTGLTRTPEETITGTSEINKANSSYTTNNEMLDHHLRNVKMDQGTRKKDIRNTMTHLQVRESDTNMNVDGSPTSRRVNNLIKSLNERNNAKTFSNSNGSNCDVNESLDQEKFKGSFFMNYFNKKENQDTYDTSTCGTEIIEYDDKKDIEILGENDLDNAVNSDSHLGKRDSRMSERKARDAQESNFVSKKHRNCENNLGSRIEDHSTIPSTSYGTKEEGSSTSVIANENDKQMQSSSIRLQEIFPDLNNIDPSIVPLLPLDLQKEAKLYMKPQHKSTVKPAENIMKSSKSKSNKQKTIVSKGKKGNNMDTFLIKGNSCKSTDLPLKRCTQCGALIPIIKYDEHNDFHVAESLQRELNNPVLNNETAKRKMDTSDLNNSSVKRRSNEIILKPEENCKPITAFLS